VKKPHRYRPGDSIQKIEELNIIKEEV